MEETYMIGLPNTTAAISRFGMVLLERCLFWDFEAFSEKANVS